MFSVRVFVNFKTPFSTSEQSAAASATLCIICRCKDRRNSFIAFICCFEKALAYSGCPALHPSFLCMRGHVCNVEARQIVHVTNEPVFLSKPMLCFTVTEWSTCVNEPSSFFTKLSWTSSRSVFVDAHGWILAPKTTGALGKNIQICIDQNFSGSHAHI